jgi:hypothetical protein
MLKTTCCTLLLLLAAGPLGFAQVSQPSETQLRGLMAFEREIESATARGDVAFWLVPSLMILFSPTGRRGGLAGSRVWWTPKSPGWT